MKGWLLVLLFATGCSPQYTSEQANNCSAVVSAGAAFDRTARRLIALDSLANTRETVLADLPALIGRFKSYPPGSTGAEEEMTNIIRGLNVLQEKVPRLGETVTLAEIDDLLNGFDMWFDALDRRCQEIHQRLAAPSVPSPAPLPAG